MARTKRCPFGIVVLAILQVVNSIQLFVSGLWCWAVSSVADTPDVRDALASSPAWLVDNLAGILFVLGLIYVILAVLAILFARGYVRGQEWARHKGRVLAALLVVYGALGVFILPPSLDPVSPFWTFLMNLVVFFYLGRESVKSYFR